MKCNKYNHFASCCRIGTRKISTIIADKQSINSSARGSHSEDSEEEFIINCMVAKIQTVRKELNFTGNSGEKSLEWIVQVSVNNSFFT